MAGVAARAQPLLDDVRPLRRLVVAGLAPIGVNFSTAVVLSEAKDRRSAQPEIVRFAQDDRLKLTPMGLAPAMLASLRSRQKNETHPFYAGHIKKKGHTGHKNASGIAGYSSRSKP